jgi:hypothetical protein
VQRRRFLRLPGHLLLAITDFFITAALWQPDVDSCKGSPLSGVFEYSDYNHLQLEMVVIYKTLSCEELRPESTKWLALPPI